MIDIGATVGNYVVRSKIGEGGMGFVFLAEHPLIGRRVAIKVIHPDYAKNPEAVSRFFVEAQAVNRIGHANIVDITDFGQSPAGDCYFVMEYLQGESLAQRLRRGRMGIYEALHIVYQMADALAASHAQGILHRDLKPDNVFLIQRGAERNFVKVLDFGLAKLTAADAKVSHKTQIGSVMGTPFYMAPEQISGRADIDGRADIYAVAVMLYEMICGQVPFSGDGYGEIIVKHMTQPAPRARVLCPDCPEWLDNLIVRCMEKDRAARLQNMGEMRDTIGYALQSAFAPGSQGNPAMIPGWAPGKSQPPQTIAMHSSIAPLGPPPPAPPPASQPPATMAMPGSQPPAHISTLGLSSGQTGTRTQPPRKSNKLLYGAVIGVAIGGATVGILLMQGGGKKPVAAAAPIDPTPPSPVSPTTTPTPTPETPTPEAPTPEAPTPAQVVLKLTSDPTNAEVKLDGKVLGTTPFDWTTAHATTTVELVFHKTGYQDRTLAVVPDSSRTLAIELPAVVAASSNTKTDKPADKPVDKPKVDKPKTDKPSSTAKTDKPKTDKPKTELKGMPGGEDDDDLMLPGGAATQPKKK